jgi:hypothetical protein
MKSGGTSAFTNVVDNKGTTKSHKLKVDRQYNGQTKIDKETNNRPPSTEN